LKKDIKQQYRNISDEMLGEQNTDIDKEELLRNQEQNAHENSEELLRIHYYFEEIWIGDILHELSSLSGEVKGKKSKSLKV
jgi:tryptophan 2,3-dioxygenase